MRVKNIVIIIYILLYGSDTWIDKFSPYQRFFLNSFSLLIVIILSLNLRSGNETFLVAASLATMEQANDRVFLSKKKKGREREKRGEEKWRN